MIKKIKPDIGIIHGGEFGETRSFLKSLKKNKLDCCVIESFSRNRSNPIRYLWNYPTLKTDNQNVSLAWKKFIKNIPEKKFIESTNFERINKIVNQIGSFSRIQSFKKSNQKYINELKNNKLKKIIITTSYNFESHDRLKNNYFESQNKWFKDLIDKLIHYNNIEIYLKLHPTSGSYDKKLIDYFNVNNDRNFIVKYAEKIKNIKI